MNTREVYCTCLYMEKTGVGCSHIFKILMVMDKSLMYGIDKRWNVDENLLEDFLLQNNVKTRRGPAKATRRNKLK